MEKESLKKLRYTGLEFTVVQCGSYGMICQSSGQLGITRWDTDEEELNC